MKKGVFFIVMLSLILFPLVNAQGQAFQVNLNPDTGIQVIFPRFETFKLNQDFNLTINTHNISDGRHITDANCTIFIVNQTGKIIINQKLERANDLGEGLHVIFLNKGNFSQKGFYDLHIDCQTSNIGGLVDGIYKVTDTGEDLDTPKVVIYLTLLFGALFFFLLCLYGGIALPFKNKRNEAAKIIAIERLKYFKLALLFLSYILFVWIANLLFALANNFNILTSYIAFFEIMFRVINSFSFVVFVIMFVSMLFLAWKDLQLEKLLSRGINPKG